MQLLLEPEGLLEDTTALRMHQPEAELCIGIALLGGLPVPVNGFSGVIRHDADVNCGATDRSGRNRKTSQDSESRVPGVQLISENAMSSLRAQGFLEAD